MMKRVIFVGMVVAVVLVAGWWARYRFSPSTGFGERYQVVVGWPQLPAGMSTGQVAGVDVDAQGRVFVFRRADKIWDSAIVDPGVIAAPTVLVLDGGSGQLLVAWGENRFVMPHGLTVDQEGHVWLTDVGLHQVFKFDAAGNLLLTIGEAGVPGADERHFNRPTDVAVAADGSVYVSDGYVNSRVVKFDADGRYLLSWGNFGDGPGCRTDWHWTRRGGFTWLTGAMDGCRFLTPTAVTRTPGRIGAGWDGRGPFASGQMGPFL